MVRRSACGDQILGESERAPGVQNIVDDEDVAATHVEVHVAQDRDLAGRDPGLLVAGQGHEIDFRGQPHPVQRADQIGGKHEATFQDGDDEQVLELRAGDFLGQLVETPGDGLGGKDDLELWVHCRRRVVHDHCSKPLPPHVRGG